MSTIISDITDVLNNPVQYFTSNVLKELLNTFLSVEVSFSEKFYSFFKSFLNTEFDNISFNKIQRAKILLYIFQTLIGIASMPIYITRLIFSLFMVGEIVDVILYLIVLLSYILALLPAGFIIYKSIETLINILINLIFKIII